jgi:ABC-type multidrug transport system ATPase subunit/ABC-type transporter Mla maintaining outer membrane lipid asymmetry permease subunit MlaE
MSEVLQSGRRTEAGEPLIEVRALERLSLRGLDFVLAAGERVAVVGESGSGKSVFLSCLLGLARPKAGSIRVFGAEVKGPLAAVDGLGVAFQQPGLLDGWTVGQNLTMAAGRALPPSELRWWLDAIGLDRVDPAAAPGVLSGGQQKRVALARALLRGTRLVVLDEPTSGLDPGSTGRVVDWLTTQFAAEERGLLLITHDYEAALRLCGRVVLLRGGRFDEVTPPANLEFEARLSWLRDKLASAPPATLPVPETAGPRAWGTLATLWSFLLRSVPLTVAALLLLGTMLATQSSGLSPIDVSRYVPGMTVAVLFRELAPLVVGLLLASRIGAQVAAQVGGMSYTAQLDSMRLLGISPGRRLLLPFLVAAAVTYPVCILAGACAGVLGGALVAATPGSGLHLGPARYLALAREALDATLVLSCALKGLAMAAVVTAIAYRLGAKPVRGAPELGTQVTRATVLASVAVVFVDVAVSWICFTRGTS